MEPEQAEVESNAPSVGQTMVDICKLVEPLNANEKKRCLTAVLILVFGTDARKWPRSSTP